jgi:hypothetical protein
MRANPQKDPLRQENGLKPVWPGRAEHGVYDSCIASAIRLRRVSLTG